MRMPREMFPTTIIDPESGEIRTRRSHPMINNFNQFIICACRCNMDIKFIWSGTDAKALVYYCTDYITKTHLSFHDTFSLVQKAVEPNDNNDITESSVDKARKLVLRCYNSLASQQELSGVQVGTYLMDYCDHYTSHEFANIFLIAIERHLQNELEKNKATLASCPTTMQAMNTNLIDFVEDEEEATATVMDEHFSIEQSTDPQKLVLVNLRIDYQFRSSALESVCLYEFVSLFHRKTFTDKDRHIRDHPSTSTQDIRSVSGRPRQERYTFMTEHPQANSHGIIKRLKPVVPVLVGPQIPRRDREDTQERYSRAIATLFISWRNVKDLCDVNQSWCEALSSRQESISIQSKQIIENIQLLYECKKDRDAHLQQVMANVQASDAIDPRLLPRNMRIDSDDEDENLDQNETYLNLLDNLSHSNATSVISQLSEKEQFYQNEALRCLHEVGRFSNCISRLIFLIIATG
jgi:site-specific DNA-adenine methylase